MQYRFDAMLEGSEDEKNAALSPALAVPDIDKEVLMAQGKKVGLTSTAATSSGTVPASTPEPPIPEVSTAAQERRPTQDELMGYHDDDDDFGPDEEQPYM